ncbi:MAG TPA: hypothetical protein VGF56_13905 [Rhizomicrobium sp.]|jgi:hypothetical protein
MKSAVAILAACLCALALPALAATQAPGSAMADPGKLLPRGVFVLGDSGNATHLQTGWQCPARFGDYRRDDLRVYDAYGLDVSCDYALPGEGSITLYLTKRTGGDLKADFEGGKSVLAGRIAGATLLADAEQKTFPSDREWLHALYSSNTQGQIDGVWYAWYGDWTFEVRATWRANHSDAAFAMMTQMTDAARATGAHLARCAASKPPVRTGKPITDKDQLQQLSMMAGITTGAASLPDPKTGKPAAEPAPRPSEWCAEEGIDVLKTPVVMWRGLNADGTVSPFDRAWLIGDGDPVVLDASPDPDLNTILSELNKAGPAPLYTATLKKGDDTLVLGFFRGRPDGGTLAVILFEYHAGYASVLASFNGKTNTITISVPTEPNGHPKD